MAVSDDLRERVVEAVVLGGLSRNQAAARFKVSVASAVRWVKRFNTTGEISPTRSGQNQSSEAIFAVAYASAAIFATSAEAASF